MNEWTPGGIEALLERPLDALLCESEEMTINALGAVVTYSRKAFIPLTTLCRDVCHYCTFAKPPRQVRDPYLGREEILTIARRAVELGCREALFTLGDRPETRYQVARDALRALGHASTLSYLAEMAQAVFAETGLLPHLNAGLMNEADYTRLRPVAASMGLMLETTSERLSAPGGPHHGSVDKAPARRLERSRRRGGRGCRSRPGC